MNLAEALSEKEHIRNNKETIALKKSDMIIYGCVIIGAGVGLLIDRPFPAVCVGLGAGYLIKYALDRE